MPSKYNRAGGRVSYFHYEADHLGAVASGATRDTGPGITRETHDLPKLFIPFQASQCRGVGIEGTGLEAGTLRRLVEAMDGTSR